MNIVTIIMYDYILKEKKKTRDSQKLNLSITQK